MVFSPMDGVAIGATGGVARVRFGAMVPFGATAAMVSSVCIGNLRATCRCHAGHWQFCQAVRRLRLGACALEEPGATGHRDHRVLLAFAVQKMQCQHVPTFLSIWGLCWRIFFFQFLRRMKPLWVFGKPSEPPSLPGH